MKTKLLLALTLFLSGTTTVCQGALVTALDQLTGTVVSVEVAANPDRDDWAIDNLNLFPSLSIDVLASTENATAWTGHTPADGNWGLVDNGDWSNGGPNGVAFDGMNVSGDIMYLTLSTPVSGFAFYMNARGGAGSNFTLTARLLNDDLIETTTGEIVTADAINQGVFRGLRNVSGVANISKIEFSGSFPVFSSFSYSTQSQNVIPEPSTFSMLAFGCIAMAGYTRLRRRRK
jgi:hypothetical protein